MDFVGFETFSENDILPSPQPSLSIPLKSNIENISAKLSNFRDLKNLLSQNSIKDTEDDDSESKLADQYAKLSLRLLEGPSKVIQNASAENISIDRHKSDALSVRLSRALNPNISDTRLRELFTSLEPKLIENSQLVDSGIDGSLSRKNLRSEVEADLIQINSTQLSNYAKPLTNLRYLGDRLYALENLIEETKELLAHDFLATTNLRNSISTVSSEKTSVDLKKALLDTFRQKFALNEYEEFLLTSSEINADFFEALKRAEGINEACLVLLALDNPDLGRRIMTKTGSLINKANDKIITFCSRSLSNTHSLNTKERVSVLHLCLHQLKHRPDQLDVILKALVESRSYELSEEFSLQVNGQESKDSNMAHADSRPVYLSSHDPLRFITDMLAYVHSAAANESEIISGLLQSEEYLSKTIDETVNQIMETLTNPIRSKIEQVISVESKLSVLYQIFNVLELYLVMFNKSIHARAISNSIEEGINLIQEKFKIILLNRLATIHESNSAKLELSSDLQPPEWITEYFSDILPIIDSMQSSTIFGVSRENNKEFLELVTDRPIKIFEEHMESVSNSFNKREKIIFKINFLDLVVSRIIPLRLLGDKMLEINFAINDHSQKIKELHFQSLLSDCGLTDHYNVMNMICPTEEDFAETSLYSAISESKIFKREVLFAIDEKIQAVIPSALLDIQSNLMKLNNPIIVNDIVTSSSIRFIHFYKLFADVIVEYVNDASLTWSYHEIATLLGADNIHTTTDFDQ